jgi:GAF domain-containing protein
MEQVVQWSDAVHAALSLDEHIAHLLEAAREAVGVDRLHLWAVAPQGDRLLYVVSSGLSEVDLRSLKERPELPLAHAGAMARAVREAAVLLVDNCGAVPAQPGAGCKALYAKRFLITPLAVRGRAIGVLVADNDHSNAPLVVERLRLLHTFALHLAIAVDNARLSAALERRETALTEALEQQTATGEILRTISGSPTDIQPVLDAVARTAARLGNANDVVIVEVEGDSYRRMAGELSLKGFQRPITACDVLGL